MTKYTNTGNKDTRSGFGEGLLAIGRECKDVVALAADLKGSVKMDAFAKEFPERFFQAGIAVVSLSYTRILAVGKSLAAAFEVAPVA